MRSATIIAAAAALLTVCSLTGLASGFECYQCSYSKINETVSGDVNCQDGQLRRSLLTTCPPTQGNINHCAKWVVSKTNYEYVHRACAAFPMKQTSCREGPVTGTTKLGTTCVCSAKECNAATRLGKTNSLALPLVPAAILAIISKIIHS